MSYLVYNILSFCVLYRTRQVDSAWLNKTLENYNCWYRFVWIDKGFMVQTYLYPVSVSLVRSQNWLQIIKDVLFFWKTNFFLLLYLL